jgi:nucleoside-diphosphate-sugar epimerase
MTRDEAVGETFNIGYPRCFTWEEVVKYIAEKTNRSYTELILDVFWEFELSVEKAQRLLGFAPKYDYRAMIDDALRFRAGQDIGVVQGQSYFALA